MKLEDLTEEQRKKLSKLKRKFMMKGSFAVLLYISWLFIANILTVMIDTLYVHNQQFVFLFTIGTALIILVGLKGTIDEIAKEISAEAKKIVEEK